MIAAAVVISGAGTWYLLNGIKTGGTPPASPTCDLIQEDDSAPVFIITNLDGPAGWLPWSDVLVVMHAYPNDPETYISVSYLWFANQVNLTSEDGLSITQSLVEHNNSDLALICNITDVQGNGFVDDGDYFTLVPVGEHSLMPGVTYTFKLYSGDLMSRLEFIAPAG
jgi:hypothetical protein